MRVDPELLELFRGYHARRKSEFVIESDSPPPPFDAPYGVYRCMNEMRALLAWLRAKGVVSKTPLHTLRKEFGSQINARYGLLAASEALRHGGIGVTARHYVENRSARSSASVTFLQTTNATSFRWTTERLVMRSDSAGKNCPL